MLRKWLRKVLTKTYCEDARDTRSRKAKRVRVPPSEKLVLGLTFAIVMVICLSILEITYVLVLQQWSSEIFSAITGLSGTILGAFFGAKT